MIKKAFHLLVLKYYTAKEVDSKRHRKNSTSTVLQPDSLNTYVKNLFKYCKEQYGCVWDYMKDFSFEGGFTSALKHKYTKDAYEILVSHNFYCTVRQFIIFSLRK